MRIQKWNWMSAALVLGAMALVATGGSAQLPDPEQALLGRTKAMFQVYEVSTSKPPISGEPALLGKIPGSGVRTVAAKSRIRVTASFALLGQ